MRKKRLLSLSLAAIGLAVLIGLAWVEVPYLTGISRFTLASVAVLLVAWLLLKVLRVFLWRVGRRLAFSYFLIGVMPIGLMLLLFGAALFLLLGFFLGHLYRDAVGNLYAELVHAAEVRLAQFSRGNATPPEEGGIIFAYYRDGRRVGGSDELPQRWPDWLSAVSPAAEAELARINYVLPSPEGTPALAAPLTEGRLGVLALFGDDLGRTLSHRTGLWVQYLVTREPRSNLPAITIGGRRIFVIPQLTEEQREARRAFFAQQPPAPGIWDKAVFNWGELPGPLWSLDAVEPVADTIPTTLTATPRNVTQALFASSNEIHAIAWLTIIAVSGLLLTIYVAAGLLAFLMIVGLSRAVNRLSRATEAVRKGDFSSRIPVKRRDQLGELQRSFNLMSEHLEELVKTAAQKEVLDKELEIAREVQRSLVRTQLPQFEQVELASLFEPTAAIGGDYFDVLELDDHRVGLIIADVSGHGLSTGLRMAMLKAALLILAEEGRSPEEILHRLDALVRSSEDQRYFVTATLAQIDLRQGSLDLINAGHPPTYLLRDAAVQEILLPGSPLGGIGDTLGRRSLELRPGDTVVWLSDGLIEATNSQGEPFGYKRVLEVLAGASTAAADVRDRLVEAVNRFCNGRPAEDDRTLLVMRYRV